MSRRLTQQEFLDKAVAVHGDKYDYSKVLYVKSNSKIDVVCKIHGDFLVTPAHHIYGSKPTGCPKCGLLVKGDRIDVSNIEVPKGAKAIPLTRGQYTIVDEEDYEWLSQHNWYLNKARGATIGYAFCTIDGKAQSMHRLLTKCPPDRHIDHKNLNSLDNRRFNLRECTQAENMMNLPPNKKSSKYKGVHRVHSKWRATISLNKKQTTIGIFIDEVEAAKAYDEAAILHYGEFANLNFKTK